MDRSLAHLAEIATVVSRHQPGEAPAAQQRQQPQQAAVPPPPGIASRRFSDVGAVSSALRKRKSLPQTGPSVISSISTINAASVLPPGLTAAQAAVVAQAQAQANSNNKRQKTSGDTKESTVGAAANNHNNGGGEHNVRFREYQAEIWSEKFEELCTFRRFYGHCHVPHTYEANAPLAQWVKRQRYQYKLRQDGKRSTLSDERVRLLNDLGFIWNSHDAVWEERLNELLLFKKIYGHCIVPSSYDPNPQLAVWVKRQRRQYKFLQEGKSTSMTPERIAKLEQHGFAWDCRKNKDNDAGGQRSDPTTSITGVKLSPSLKEATSPKLLATNATEMPLKKVEGSISISATSKPKSSTPVTNQAEAMFLRGGFMSFCSRNFGAGGSSVKASSSAAKEEKASV